MALSTRNKKDKFEKWKDITKVEYQRIRMIFLLSLGKDVEMLTSNGEKLELLNSYFASLFAKGNHGPWMWGGNSQVPEYRGRARRLEKN